MRIRKRFLLVVTVSILVGLLLFILTINIKSQSLVINLGIFSLISVALVLISLIVDYKKKTKYKRLSIPILGCMLVWFISLFLVYQGDPLFMQTPREHIVKRIEDYSVKHGHLPTTTNSDDLISLLGLNYNMVYPYDFSYDYHKNGNYYTLKFYGENKAVYSIYDSRKKKEEIIKK